MVLFSSCIPERICRLLSITRADFSLPGRCLPHAGGGGEAARGGGGEAARGGGGEAARAGRPHRATGCFSLAGWLRHPIRFPDCSLLGLCIRQAEAEAEAARRRDAEAARQREQACPRDTHALARHCGAVAFVAGWQLGARASLLLAWPNWRRGVMELTRVNEIHCLTTVRRGESACCSGV